jgi:hypothetical protein
MEGNSSSFLDPLPPPPINLLPPLEDVLSPFEDVVVVVEAAWAPPAGEEPSLLLLPSMLSTGVADQGSMVVANTPGKRGSLWYKSVEVFE